jgi:hypothetical protein
MVLASVVEATLGRVAALGRTASSASTSASGVADAGAATLRRLGAAKTRGTSSLDDLNEHAKIITDGVDFRPVTDTSCFVDAYRSSDAATAVMFVFISGCVLGAVPQYLKVVVLGTSEGLSLSSLALMNVSNVCATMNVFILHYEQIRRCVAGAAGYEYERCQASLLTLYYTLIYTLLWIPLYPLAAHFTSDRKTEYFGYVMSKRKAAWYGLALWAVPCALLAAPVARMLFGSTCFEFERYAIFLGLTNAVLETTRYVPQLWESVHSKGSGAMSYMRLALSVAGGLGATIQKAVMHESWSTWGPPLIGHGLEMAIFCVNLFNDMTRRRERTDMRKEALGLMRDSDDDYEDSRDDMETDAHAKRKAAMLESAESAARTGSPTKSESDVEDWVQNIPTEGGFKAKTYFVWHRACTDKHFFTSLVRYL